MEEAQLCSGCRLRHDGDLERAGRLVVEPMLACRQQEVREHGVAAQKDPLPDWMKPYIERVWAWVFSSTGSKIAWLTVVVGLGQIASPWWLPIVEAIVRIELPNVTLATSPMIGMVLVVSGLLYHLAYHSIESSKGKVTQPSEFQLQQDRELFVNTYLARRSDLRLALQWTGNWLMNVRDALTREQPSHISTSYIVERGRYAFEPFERVHDLTFFDSVDALRGALNELEEAVFHYNDTAWILSDRATFAIAIRELASLVSDEDDPERVERRQKAIQANADRMRRYAERYPGCELVGDIMKHPSFIADVEAAKSQVAACLPAAELALKRCEEEVRRVERQHQRAIEGAAQ